MGGDRDAGMEKRLSPSRRQVIGGLGAAGVLAAVPRARAATPEKWRHGIVQAKGDAGFFFMAQRKGFLARRGIEAEIVEFKGGKDVMRGILAGDIDSGDSSPGEVLPAVEKGAALRLLGSTVVGYTYALYVRPGISDWAELKGKRFGISAPGSTPHIMVLGMLAAKGVDSDSVEFATAGGSTSRFQALAAGRLDAVAASSEFIPLARELGVTVLARSRDVLPSYPRFFVTSRAETVARRRDAAIGFLAGYVEGLRHCADNRAETIALAAEINGEKADDPRYAFAYDEIVEGKALSLNLDLPVDRIVWLRDMMVKVGELQKPMEIPPLVEAGPREAALKLVGTR